MFDCRPLEANDPGDIDAVCSLPQDPVELFHSFPRASWPLTREQLVKQVHRRNHSTVVTDGDRVIAYANLYGLVIGRKCFIGNLVVDPVYRGKGVATQLIKYLQELAITRYRAQQIHLSVFDENRAASQLYHRLGYRAYEEEVGMSPEGDNVILVHMKRLV